MSGAKLYRFDAIRTTGGVYVYRREFPVVKRTPRGAWIDMLGSRRFVLDGARKRFAWPTEDEARESFRARKRRQIKILSAQLHDAKEALAMIDTVATDGLVFLRAWR